MTSSHTIRARDRYDQLRALSRMGATRNEAARSVGVSLKGMNGILYRELGTQVWPIAATSLRLSAPSGER